MLVIDEVSLILLLIIIIVVISAVFGVIIYHFFNCSKSDKKMIQMIHCHIVLMYCIDLSRDFFV